MLYNVFYFSLYFLILHGFMICGGQVDITSQGGSHTVSIFLSQYGVVFVLGNAAGKAESLNKYFSLIIYL